MPKLKKKDKEILVEDLVAKIKSYEGLILSDFQGLNVEKMTKMRRSLHGSGIYLKVIKNRLAKIAFDKVPLPEKAKETLKGRPTVVALITDPFLAARDLIKFYKDEEINFNFKAGFILGKEIDFEFFKEISSISSVQEVYGKFVNILISPIGQLVTSLGGIYQKLAVALNQVANKKEVEGRKSD